MEQLINAIYFLGGIAAGVGAACFLYWRMP